MPDDYDGGIASDNPYNYKNDVEEDPKAKHSRVAKWIVIVFMLIGIAAIFKNVFLSLLK